MTWRADYPAPISFAPVLWERGYRDFWCDWLQGRQLTALLRMGDWWQP